MKVGKIVRIGMWLLAIGAVGVFAACGDDDEKTACPVAGMECEYDGNSLISCTSDSDCTQADNYSCVLDSGEPAMDGAVGNCARNIATTTAVDVTLPAINWEWPTQA